MPIITRINAIQPLLRNAQGYDAINREWIPIWDFSADRMQVTCFADEMIAASVIVSHGLIDVKIYSCDLLESADEMVGWDFLESHG